MNQCVLRLHPGKLLPWFFERYFSSSLGSIFDTKRSSIGSQKKTPPEAKEMKLDLSHFVFLSADWGPRA